MALIREDIRSDLNNKTCSKCKILKAITVFNKKSDTRDGLQPYCRECISIAKKKSKEKKTEVI